MTSIVGIRCSDGVIVGADSSATFGSGPFSRTIEQTTHKKVEIVGNSSPMIVAGTGYVGHHQRFVEVVRNANAKGEFSGKRAIHVGKLLSRHGITDFGETIPALQMERLSYSALVAFAADGRPCLCELDGSTGFQPELKMQDDLWFSSVGSGQSITDPFLALFRSVFWRDGAPDIRGGIFTAYWALSHACDINPGGINYPIKIAVLKVNGQKTEAKLLPENEIQETADLVQSATDHMRGFKDLLLGIAGSQPPPTLS